MSGLPARPAGARAAILPVHDDVAAMPEAESADIDPETLGIGAIPK